MRIWLDDIRPMPASFDTYIKTAHEAIELIKSGSVEAISLDHDLGEPENGTGYDVASFIEEQAFHGNIPPLEWSIHSDNIVGVQNMQRAMQNADRYWQRNKKAKILMNWYKIAKSCHDNVSEDELGMVREFAGLRIQVENPAGTERIGLRPDGSEWRVQMKYDYGFVSCTEGEDGEGVDVFLGPDHECSHAFVVHQVNPETGSDDEDKVMLGFVGEEEAKAAYLHHYDSSDFFGSMTTMTIDEFKDAMKSGDKIHLKDK